MMTSYIKIQNIKLKELLVVKNISQFPQYFILIRNKNISYLV